MVYRPTARVLTVLELLQSHDRMTGAELARRLEVDVRTVRNYVQTLTDLGIPVEAERGRYGAYHLRAGYKLPPLIFTEDEALALTLSLLVARASDLVTAAPAFAGVLAKVERVLPAATRAHIQAVEQTVAFDRGSATSRTFGSGGVLAKHYDIGLNIDAEEADRLELSLDLLEALALDPNLAGWNGIGFVIQAYGKRCPFVVDWLVDLARGAKRRIMVRLVKGAYWDSEIKRAQVDGLEGFPVFTRKAHTDVSYLACARKLLAAPDAVFPQFATHNAQTLATITEMAGPNFYRGQYEFQCLHGMGEPLYEEVVGSSKLDRPSRIYAPVGTHETLLAYLVRRLLENGANSSFVNRIADEQVPVEELIADPIETVRAMPIRGAPHEHIALPRHLYGSERANSAGLDLTNEDRLTELASALEESTRAPWTAAPTGSQGGHGEPVRNPADRRDVVGHARHAARAEIETALATAASAASAWAATSAPRVACLRRAADVMEARMPVLIGLIVREAGKSFAERHRGGARGGRLLTLLRCGGEPHARGRPVPAAWADCLHLAMEFPLAIFTGQVAAALAAGNPVLAKPAEETPLVAAESVRLLHGAGVPADVLQLVPGAGEVGAALVADARVMGVMFTGSTAVARLIQRQLAERLTPAGQPVPLIAETGGQNALVVNSSALAEQVVADVIASAFDRPGSAARRFASFACRRTLQTVRSTMLKGAMRELVIGNPDRLSIDVGPVITAEARDSISQHIQTMQERGHAIEQLPLPSATEHGTFVPPTLIEIRRCRRCRARGLRAGAPRPAVPAGRP